VQPSYQKLVLTIWTESAHKALTPKSFCTINVVFWDLFKKNIEAKEFCVQEPRLCLILLHPDSGTFVSPELLLIFALLRNLMKTSTCRGCWMLLPLMLPIWVDKFWVSWRHNSIMPFCIQEILVIVSVGNVTSCHKSGGGSWSRCASSPNYGFDFGCSSIYQGSAPLFNLSTSSGWWTPNFWDSNPALDQSTDRRHQIKCWISCSSKGTMNSSLSLVNGVSRWHDAHQTLRKLLMGFPISIQSQPFSGGRRPQSRVKLLTAWSSPVLPIVCKLSSVQVVCDFYLILLAEISFSILVSCYTRIISH